MTGGCGVPKAGGPVGGSCQFMVRWVLRTKGVASTAHRGHGVRVLTLMAVLAPGVAWGHRLTLTVGVVPQRSALALALAWTPVLQSVGRAAGLRLEFETAKNIPTFERRLYRGAYDIAYLNPYQYLLAHRQKGYTAFLRGDGHLRSVIVVRRDSRLGTLAALAGHRVAFPAPGSLAASMLPQALLARDHIPIRPVYVASHGSVYRAVAEGLYRAGGGVVQTFRDFPAPVRDQLRILWTGPPLPPHPLAARSDIPRAIVQRLRTAFLALARTGQGRADLARLGLRAFVVAHDRDYDVIRQWRLLIPSAGS